MKWSYLIKIGIRKFPQWALAGFIVVTSSVLFLGWMMFRGFFNHGADVRDVSIPSLPEFQASGVILCGNTMIDRESGKILAEEWLQGFGSVSPPIAKVMADEKLVIVAANNGAVGAFGFNGKPKPVLQFDGKPVAFAAFDHDFRQVVFPREGNLWRGLTDWQNGKISEAKKFTDTGYFRDDVFGGPWLWLEDDLLVSLMGKTLEVESDGTVKEVPVSLGQLRQGFSPDGSFAIVSTGRELRVVDLVSGETQQFPVGQRVRKLLWLSPKKVVIQVGHDLLAEYNGVSKELQGPQQIDGGIRDILEPSPDGSCFLVVGAKSILILDPTTKRHAELEIQFNEVAWVDNEHLLCSSSAVETDQRGLWLINKSGVGEKISDQPLDQSTGRSFSPIAVTRVGAYIVSQGDLWLLQRRSGESTLKQITHDQKLSPELQTLDY